MVMKRRKRNRLKWEKAVIADYTHLRGWPDVVSVCLGLKEVGGKLTKRRCVKVYLRRKKSLKHLKCEPLPTTALVLVPSGSKHYSARRLPTDVVEFKGIKLAAGCSKPGGDEPFPTVPSGAQIGPAGSGAGSLGCLVWSRESEQELLLTVGHLFSGGTGPILPGIPVFQPSYRTDRRLGVTVDGFIGNDTNPKSGFIDVALINRELPVTNQPWGAASPALQGFIDINEINRTKPSIYKVGSKTGLTYGDYSGYHPCIDTEIGEARNVLEFKLSPDDPSTCIAVEGDSGCLFVTRSPDKTEGLVVGLLFAVEDVPNPTRAYVIPFDRIANRFNLEIVKVTAPVFA